MQHPLPTRSNNSEGIHRLGAPFGMHPVEGQLRRRSHVQPVQRPCHAPAALVQMDHRRLRDLAGQHLSERLQLRKDPLISRHQRPHTQGLPEEIFAQLRQPIIRQQLLLVQIHHQALKARPILHRRTHPRWKLRAHLRVTTRTTLDLGPVFRHLQRARRQIEDLAALVVQHRFPARTTSAALRTNCQRMNLNMVWLFNPSQGLTWVSGLAPGPATAAGAQTLGARFLQPVAGRRLVAVRAVLGQAPLQVFQPLFQLRHPFLEGQEQFDQCAPGQAP